MKTKDSQSMFTNGDFLKILLSRPKLIESVNFWGLPKSLVWDDNFTRYHPRFPASFASSCRQTKSLLVMLVYMQRHEIDIIPWAKQILALMRSYIFKPIFLGGLKKKTWNLWLLWLLELKKTPLTEAEAQT